MQPELQITVLKQKFFSLLEHNYQLRSDVKSLNAKIKLNDEQIRAIEMNMNKIMSEEHKKYGKAAMPKVIGKKEKGEKNSK